MTDCEHWLTSKLSILLQSELLPVEGTNEAMVFERIDDFFTWVFFFELLFNLFANWFSPFFGDGWACFDLLVVTVSMIAYFSPGGSSGPLKSLRLMRAFRVMRLFGRLQSLRQIISSLTASIIPVMNAFLIMLLVYCPSLSVPVTVRVPEALSLDFCVFIATQKLVWSYLVGHTAQRIRLYLQ